MDPTLHCKMKVAKLLMDRERGCNPDLDGQKPDVNMEIGRDHGRARAQKQTVVSVVETDVQSE